MARYIPDETWNELLNELASLRSDVEELKSKVHDLEKAHPDDLYYHGTVIPRTR